MVDTRQATVVGIFANRPRADEAITALQNAGFQNSQIRQYVGKSRSGPLTGIKNALSAEQKTPEAVVNDLLDMGVAPEHTKFYQREYEAGHPVVAVTSSKRLQEASAILQTHGGYGPQEEKRADTYAAGAAGAASGASMAQRETGRTTGGYDIETEQRGRGERREEDLRGRGELQ